MAAISSSSSSNLHSSHQNQNKNKLEFYSSSQQQRPKCHPPPFGGWQNRQNRPFFLSTKPTTTTTTSRQLYSSQQQQQQQQQHDGLQRENNTASTSVRVLSPLAQSIQASIQTTIVSSSPRHDDHPATIILVLSVSGGCDSMALLHACMEYVNLNGERNIIINNNNNEKETIDVQTHVVHFHHRQRNDGEADADCSLVQDVCRHYQIPCHVEDWKERAAGNDSSATRTAFSQEIARNWRREGLLARTQQLVADSIHPQSSASTTRSTRSTRSTGLILTAHHKGDSYESFWLKWMRGVHLLNLSGMTAATQLDDSPRSLIYLLRPWLDWHKQDLYNYLQQHNYTWREDASNASPKYLRNRIRNELLPLLEDLTNGNMEARLDTLVAQSQELRHDVQPRVEAYLNKVINDKGWFLIGNVEETTTGSPSASSSSSSLIVSQALYQWMSREISRKNNGKSATTAATTTTTTASPMITYDTLQRVLQQLEDYPQQLEWTLELGGHWNVQRQGSVLKLISATANSSGIKQSSRRIPWSWSLEKVKDQNHSEDDDDDTIHSVTLVIPPEWMTSDLVVLETTVGAQNAMSLSALWFVPPWRSSPVKLRQFLRAKEVPLQERDDSPILVGRDDEIVAVRVRDKWIVHKDYYPPSHDNEGVAIVVSAPKDNGDL
jgi:tRNA(Ile)-lysidine synthetase-like protein